MADPHRGRLRVRLLPSLHFALMYEITQQPPPSDVGGNISGPGWRTAPIPPTLGFMQTFNVERCNNANDHRGEERGGGLEEPALLTGGLQDWWRVSRCPLAFNFEKLHRVSSVVHVHMSSVRKRRDVKKKKKVAAKWKMSIINRCLENECKLSLTGTLKKM